MRIHGETLKSAAVGTLLTIALWVPAQVSAQSADAVPRLGGKPNLNGIWQAINTANWNVEDHSAMAGMPQIGVFGAIPPGVGVVEGGEIPYKPDAAAKRRENLKNRFKEDPEAKCYMPGIPRGTYMPYPFQIIQGTAKMMIVYGFAEANRTIHMDKAKPEPAPIDSWMGRSHGRWDGDTLVVDVAGFNGLAWLDRSGNFTTDTLKVTERYSMQGPNVVMYEATLEDPAIYTRPWKISMPLYRRLEKNAQVLEWKCVEFSEELLYGHLRRQETK
jgi:hypothetical protein